MTITSEHIDFENHCRKIIGVTVVRVEYSEICYEPERPKPYYPTKFQNLHSVDFSIFFHTKDNDIIEFYWDGKFFEFGIGIKINAPSNFLGYITWDVSYTDLWNKFIGTNITDVKVTWETVTTTEQKTGKSESFTYPQDIKIAFSNNQAVFISAAGFLNQGDSKVYGMLDNLTVTDNEKLARQVKMIV